MTAVPGWRARATGSPARPLGRVLSTRLAVTAAIALVLLGAALAWLYTTQHAHASRHAQAEAAAHFAARTRQIDADWVRQADLLRGQIEFSGVLDGDDPVLASARLTAFLTSMGGQNTFSHYTLLDKAQRTIFRYSTRTQAALTPTSLLPLSWMFSPQDRIAYRVLRSPLRLGARGAGEVVLFAPADNALLAANAYPGTSISLHWGAHGDLATSFSGPGPHPAPQAAQLQDEVFVSWAGEPGAPELHIARAVLPVLPLRELLGVVAAGVAVGAALVWLVLGRWARDHVRRISALSSAARQFSQVDGVDPATTARLDAAIEDASLEVHGLGNGLKTLLAEVTAAHAAQQAAQEHLRELNASLERRVDERTRELGAARDAALAAMRAKEQFLTGISHELRTPLVGLLGGLELIEDDGLPDPQQRLLQVARRSGEALRDVINEVLDYSKLDAGRVDLAHQPFRASAVADEAVALFAAVALRKGLSLTCHKGPGSEQPVLGDPARVRQVLLNLLGNAMKFTDRGCVDLYVGVVDVDDPAMLRLRFSVEDSGIGIDDDLARQLFQPFIQAEPTGQHSRGGSGLGLAISQRLVAAMGGRIDLRSAPGKGSVFGFDLTLPRAELAAPTVPAPAPQAALRGRVLLVEDNPVNRIVAGTMLQRLGVEVQECGNGLEAIAALLCGSFDLVLMDNQMPVLDGMAATRRIRAGDAGPAAAGLPILAVTASALDGDAERCIAAGMSAHLTKPFSQTELGAAIAPWLGVKAEPARA